MTEHTIDVLAIGDVVTDAFIKLLDDQAWTYKDENGNKILAMPYGMKFLLITLKLSRLLGMQRMLLLVLQNSG